MRTTGSSGVRTYIGCNAINNRIQLWLATDITGPPASWRSLPKNVYETFKAEGDDSSRMSEYLDSIGYEKVKVIVEDRSDR